MTNLATFIIEFLIGWCIFLPYHQQLIVTEDTVGDKENGDNKKVHTALQVGLDLVEKYQERKKESQNEPNCVPLLVLMWMMILNKGILNYFQHLLEKEAGYLLKDFG